MNLVFKYLQMTTNCTQGAAIVPVRLKGGDARFLSEAAGSTGYKQAELIRRALRLVKAEAKRTNSFNFLLALAADV